MIDKSRWKKFCVGELFSCETTLGVLSKNDLENGDINYITRSAANNGFSGTCGNKDRKNKGNCITIGAEGFVAFWQTDDFVAGNKVYALKHHKMNELSGLFVCFALNTLSDKYSFADARVLDKIKVEVINLPATPEGKPDWDYMESYMKKIMEGSEKSFENLKKNKSTKRPIDVSEWGEFNVTDFFTVLPVKTKLSNADIDGGGTPVYSSHSTNGGIFGYTTKKPAYEINDDNPFYIVFGDHTKAVNIADQSFCVMDNVKILTSDIRNYYVLRFMITSWLNNVPDLGYARHWSEAEKTKIYLPITSDGKPNWNYMEAYMKKVMEESENIVSNLQITN